MALEWVAITLPDRSAVYIALYGGTTAAMLSSHMDNDVN